MIRVVRIGDPRLGTVRLLPRGVRKEEYSKRNLFDVWAPAVSPTRELVAYAQAKPWTDARWAAYRKRYLREMQRPEAQPHVTAVIVGPRRPEQLTPALAALQQERVDLQKDTFAF